MFVEQQAARSVIRGWWPEQLPDPKADAILDGFAAYLQSLIVEGIFDRRHLRPGHSVEVRPYFGNHLIWSFPPLRLSRHTLVARERHAAVFDALERWIGLPALQGAMAQVARLPENRLQGTTIINTISDAAGQDLSWAFAAADAAEVNYAVTELSSVRGQGCGSPCVDTSVAVARTGAGTFAGRSTPRLGAFESGDAVLIAVTFADGTRSAIRWDGRDSSRTFQFRGAAPATAAYLDPDRVITLDANRLDDAIVAPSPTNVPVGKWTARWLVWLQHTMLSYGFLA